MVAVPGSIHDKYQFFISNLAHASRPEGLVEVFFRMTQPLNASAVALIIMSHHADGRPTTGHARTASILACQGPEAFWSDYMDLCRTRRDLISRILRLSRHTLALSDIQRHPRLARRATCLESLLLSHGLNDVFAVPTILPTRWRS